MLDQIEIDLRGSDDKILTVYIDIADNSLSRKWLSALNDIIQNDLHLEKNYCWLGWAESIRNPEYLCTQLNRSIHAINSATLGYVIQDFFSPANTIADNGGIVHEHMNQLHRYFEDLQGTAGAMSPYYTSADDYTRWHIRQLNLLCHELESLVLSIRKAYTAPEWRRPSQLMCWLNAPRYELDDKDLELFGIETINRKLGGVYVGEIKQWASIIGRYSVMKAGIQEFQNWLLQACARRLRPLATLTLNGHVIPAHTLGKSSSWLNFERGLNGMDSTQMMQVLQSATLASGRLISSGHLVQTTGKTYTGN